MLPCWRAHHVKYKGSTGIQWPPTPTPGLKGMNPYGFDDAASITSKTLIPFAEQSWVNSFTNAIFTKRKVFSSSFAASAISGFDTEIAASQIDS